MRYIGFMRHPIALALFICLTGAPLAAQTEDDEPSLMEKGMQQFFEGLRDEMSPALRDLQGLMLEYGPKMREFLEEMGPAMGRVLDEVEDWTMYEAPEILPNGDIIMRRKPDPEAEQEPDTEPKTREPDLPPSGVTDL